LIQQILIDSGVDARTSEATLLVPDSYGKVSISLDEMMPDVEILEMPILILLGNYRDPGS
jgi:hypothetical protein